MSITHDELPLFDSLPLDGSREASLRERHLVLVPEARVRPAAPVRATTPALQLTRRGRVVLTLLALVIVSGLMIVFGAGTAATGSAGEITGTTTVTVQPGQTLWSIAGEANSGGDIRDAMDDIVRLNSLVDGQPLQMGTKLAVPVYATD
jgi:hypothetical protein